MKKQLASFLTLLLMLFPGSAQAVGVIGGADGPTVIIVASVGDWWQAALIAALILAAMAALVVSLKRKKN